MSGTLVDKDQFGLGILGKLWSAGLAGRVASEKKYGSRKINNLSPKDREIARVPLRHLVSALTFLQHVDELESV
jgi:hypothetical protein